MSMTGKRDFSTLVSGTTSMLFGSNWLNSSEAFAGSAFGASAFLAPQPVATPSRGEPATALNNSLRLSFIKKSLRRYCSGFSQPGAGYTDCDSSVRGDLQDFRKRFLTARGESMWTANFGDRLRNSEPIAVDSVGLSRL